MCVKLCLRAISQFLQLLDTEFDESHGIERSFQTSLRHMFYEASFVDFVDALCQLSGKFGLAGRTSTEDVEFKGMRSQVDFSSSYLDENWALRDISRYSLALDGWQIGLLVRLHIEVHSYAALSGSYLNQNYFQLLSTHNLLLSGDYITRTLLLTKDDVSLSSGDFILESFKGRIANTYEWGANEMTVNMAMSFVSTYFSETQSSDRESALAGIIMPLYRWIVKVVLNRELSSAKVRIKAATLLRHISKVDINYGREANLEPAGMLLTKLLQDPDTRVRFDLADHIASVFLNSPVVDRITVYRDTLDSLESDEVHFERFALRAYTLMRLVFASDDIRRAAMVNLLEIGKFASVRLIVHSCFLYVAEHLYGGALAELFLQNIGQFVYSWIDFGEDIFQFPFYVFGYPDLETCYLSVTDELVAQLVNADRWQDAVNLFRQYGNFEDVLVNCLPRIIAYHFLKAGTVSGEAANITDRCKAALGDDLYYSTLVSQFARSLAIMIERLDDKTLCSQAFDSPELSAALSIFLAIGLPLPSPTYPEPSQPSFATHKVLSAIETLRCALNIASHQVWCPANTVFVLRHLFDQGLAVSDTTVALSFLRRIAFVICLAGDGICEAYPFEMLLFGLKHFIERSSVCREAMQIVKYVCSSGTGYVVAYPDRFRQFLAVLLPSLRTAHLATLDGSLSDDFYEYLERFLQTSLPGHAALQATVRVLDIVTKHTCPKYKSAGQVIEDVILEDASLWTQPELQHFASELLSAESDVFLEPLSTLRRLVTHFLIQDRVHMYSAKAKTWLGLALGRTSRDDSFSGPEYIARVPCNQTQKRGGSDGFCANAVFGEMLRFMRFDMKVAGKLEQVLRDVSTQKPLRIPPRFGPDETIVTYLSSPYIESCLNTNNLQDIQPPSHVPTWTNVNREFRAWYQSLACSIACHLPNDLFVSLVPSIDTSYEFCQSIFPYLIDEYRSQEGYDGSLTTIFNTILRNSDAVDRDYSRLIIQVILFLRERTPTPLSHKRWALVDEIDYLFAANAAVSCKMYKTALMFLEISGKREGESSRPIYDQILSEVYRNVNDSDMAYTLSQGLNRSWNQLLDVYKLRHDREKVNDLRRARLRSKVELGLRPPSGDDDLRAVADFIAQNGFPLRLENVLIIPRANNEAMDHRTVSTSPHGVLGFGICHHWQDRITQILRHTPSSFIWRRPTGSNSSYLSLTPQ
jgi:serine-protein kinase ATM